MKITKEQLGKLVESLILEQLEAEERTGKQLKIWKVTRGRYGSKESDLVMFALALTREEALNQAKKVLKDSEDLFAMEIDKQLFDLLAWDLDSEIERLITLKKSALHVRSRSGEDPDIDLKK